MSEEATVAAITVAAVLGFWILGAHNRLVRLRQGVAAAFAPVDEALRQRHELLGALVEAAGGALTDTPEAVAAVEAARAQTRVAAEHALKRPLSAGRLASLALTEQVLNSALKRLLTLVKARAALREDPALREALKPLSAHQHRLSAARQRFNATVLDYNRSARQFPTRLVAAMFGFAAAGEL